MSLRAHAAAFLPLLHIHCHCIFYCYFLVLRTACAQPGTELPDCGMAPRWHGMIISAALPDLEGRRHMYLCMTPSWCMWLMTSTMVRK